MALSDIFEAAAGTVWTIADSVMEPVTYRQKSASSVYDPATGGVTNTFTEFTGLKMRCEKYKSREIDGTRILADDVKGLLQVSALTISPAVDDEVLWDGVTYRIVNFANEDGARIIWTLQMRKA